MKKFNMRTVAFLGTLAVVVMFGVYVQGNVPGFALQSGAADTAAIVNASAALSINANPTLVQPGKPATLVWSSAGFQSCSVSGPSFSGSGTKGTRSTGPITTASTYILTCQTKAGAVSSQSVTVGLVPPTKNSTSY